MIRGFRLFFEDSKPKEIPEWFYVCPKLTWDLLKKGKSTPSGAVATLNGLEGISSSVNIFSTFFNNSPSSVGIGIQMPGEETLKLNNLSKIKYGDPNYLSSFGFRAGRRILGGQTSRRSKKDTLHSVFSSLFFSLKDKYPDFFNINHNSFDPKIISPAGNVGSNDLADFILKYNPHKPDFLWYKKPSKKISKIKNSFNFTNLNELAERILKFIKIYNLDLYRRISSSDIADILKNSIKSIFTINPDEEEWVTKRQKNKVDVDIGGEKLNINIPLNQLHVPEGSILYISKKNLSRIKEILFPNDKEITAEKAQEMVLEKLKKNYSLHLLGEGENPFEKSFLVKQPELSSEENKDKETLINALKKYKDISVENFYRFAKKNNIDSVFVSKFLRLWKNNDFIEIKNQRINVLEKDFNNHEAEVLNYIKNQKEVLGTTVDLIVNKTGFFKEDVVKHLNSLLKKNKIFFKNNNYLATEQKTQPLNDNDKIVLNLGEKGVPLYGKPQVESGKEFSMSTGDYLNSIKKLYAKDLFVYIPENSLFYSKKEESESESDDLKKVKKDILDFIEKNKVIYTDEIHFDLHNLSFQEINKAILDLLRTGKIKQNISSKKDHLKTFINSKYRNHFTKYEKIIIKILRNNYVIDPNDIIRYTENYKQIGSAIGDLSTFLKELLNSLLDQKIVSIDGRRYVVKSSVPVEQTIQAEKVLNFLKEKGPSKTGVVASTVESFFKSSYSSSCLIEMLKQKNIIRSENDPLTSIDWLYLPNQENPKFDNEKYKKIIIEKLSDKPQEFYHLQKSLKSIEENGEKFFSLIPHSSLVSFLDAMVKEGRIKKHIIDHNFYYTNNLVEKTLTNKDIENDIIHFLEKNGASDYETIIKNLEKNGWNEEDIAAILSRISSRMQKNPLVRFSEFGKYYLAKEEDGKERKYFANIMSKIQANHGRILKSQASKLLSAEELGALNKMIDYGELFKYENHLFKIDYLDEIIAGPNYRYYSDSEAQNFIIDIMKANPNIHEDEIKNRFSIKFKPTAFRLVFSNMISKGIVEKFTDEHGDFKYRLRNY